MCKIESLSYDPSKQKAFQGCANLGVWNVGLKEFRVSGGGCCRKVGEAIEAALQTMECPYPLQAHQIQGLDYPAVLPVVQWLIKRVIATRQESGDQVCHSTYFSLEGLFSIVVYKEQRLLVFLEPSSPKP